MTNFWTVENIIKYRSPVNGNKEYNGYWTERNGEKAIVMAPVPFWTAKSAFEDGVERFYHILEDELDESKTYLFDFWIDNDETIYNGANRNGGLQIMQSSSTNVNGTLVSNGLSFIASGTDGFVHKRVITSGAGFLRQIYYTNKPVYYRWDSFIIEYSETEFRKTGIVASFLVENSNEVNTIKGGATYCKEIIEV